MGWLSAKKERCEAENWNTFSYMNPTKEMIHSFPEFQLQVPFTTTPQTEQILDHKITQIANQTTKLL
jgi:hypothetical protein